MRYSETTTNESKPGERHHPRASCRQIFGRAATQSPFGYVDDVFDEPTRQCFAVRGMV